ncbi:MAG: hypothetical protein WCC74_01390 [Minisyncoccia bacterium]
MKNNKKIALLIVSFFILCTAIPFTLCNAEDAQPQNTHFIPSDNNDGTMKYVPLEKKAMINEKIDTSGNLGKFLASVYNFGVAAAAVLAVLMIAWGGVEYMTTEAFDGKSDAKSKITNALWGLLLVLASYLILYTVNPDILQIPGWFQ